jgi:ABC-type branched-subunit amino acid transport system permease subunit
MRSLPQRAANVAIWTLLLTMPYWINAVGGYYVSSATENWMFFIGLFFVVVVLFFPRGVLGIRGRRTVR